MYGYSTESMTANVAAANPREIAIDSVHSAENPGVRRRDRRADIIASDRRQYARHGYWRITCTTSSATRRYLWHANMGRPHRNAWRARCGAGSAGRSSLAAVARAAR